MKLVSTYLKGNLTDYEYDRTDYRVKYDLDNRIVEVKADSETIRYRYDALGRRIVSKGDDETILIWWGDSECAEYEHRASKDAIQNDIMGHPTRLNSVIARDTEDRENRVELQWYHKNYLDHVYAISDDDGNLIEHYRYTAFGEPEIYSATGARRNDSAIGNTVMWNTRRYDADNGLYYYKYRHYAANIGRWLGRDPIEEDGGINLYGFVGNNSINQFDLLGLTNCRYPVGSTSPLGGIVVACVGSDEDTCDISGGGSDGSSNDNDKDDVKPVTVRFTAGSNLTNPFVVTGRNATANSNKIGEAIRKKTGYRPEFAAKSNNAPFVDKALLSLQYKTMIKRLAKVGKKCTKKLSMTYKFANDMASTKTSLSQKSDAHFLLGHGAPLGSGQNNFNPRKAPTGYITGVVRSDGLVTAPVPLAMLIPAQNKSKFFVGTCFAGGLPTKVGGTNITRLGQLTRRCQFVGNILPDIQRHLANLCEAKYNYKLQALCIFH